MPKITIYIFLVVNFIIACSPIHKYSITEEAIACAGVTVRLNNIVVLLGAAVGFI